LWLAFIGFGLLGLFLVVHPIANTTHTQAHRAPEEIDHLITTGIYSKLRYPEHATLLILFLALFLLHNPNL
jgi:hypothetical protein